MTVLDQKRAYLNSVLGMPESETAKLNEEADVDFWISKLEAAPASQPVANEAPVISGSFGTPANLPPPSVDEKGRLNSATTKYNDDKLAVAFNKVHPSKEHRWNNSARSMFVMIDGEPRLF